MCPRDHFFFGFFEDIERDALGFLNRVCRFLEVEPFRGAERELFAQPVNHTRDYQVAIPRSIERYLAEQLLEPTRALARRFGGYTEAWRERMERILASA